MSPTVNPETTISGGRHRLERAGIGVVDVTRTRQVLAEWGTLEALFAGAIQGLLWNDFLVLEYDGASPESETPAAWVRTGPGGVECAVSSASQVPPEVWPHHPEFFEDAGWNCPVAIDQPWTSGPHESTEASHRVLAALRYGRSCEDPYAFRWGSGSFPVPEGRTGTLSVIDP